MIVQVIVEIGELVQHVERLQTEQHIVVRAQIAAVQFGAVHDVAELRVQLADLVESRQFSLLFAH